MYSKIYSTSKETEKKLLVCKLFFEQNKENCIPVWRWTPEVRAEFGELLDVLNLGGYSVLLLSI